MDLRLRFCVELERIRSAPEYQRVRAEVRFLFLKEFEELFEPQEKARLAGKYRRRAAVVRFCYEKRFSVTSFYRWRHKYRTHGIEALLPSYGNKGKTSAIKRKRKIPAHIWIDPSQPLKCLSQLLEIIESHPELANPAGLTAAAYLKSELRLLKPANGLILGRELTKEEREILEAYRASRHKNHSAKAAVLLMASEGRSMKEISKASGRSYTSIYRHLRFFKERGIDFIETKLDPAGRERVWQQRKTRLIDILHGTPALYGINRTSWTYPTIRDAYRQVYGESLSGHALKRIIKEAGYSWRRARKVLTSPDPEYRDKVLQLLDALQGMKAGEAFFFIDEAGPWRVKKYGGKALGPREITRTIPEVQEAKGAVNLIAALEATSNQVVWSFIRSKGSASLVALLEVLKEKYSDAPRICVTWDALGSHSSFMVKDWIDRANQEALEAKSPRFEVYPLPSNAQFLNVIEAVFGGCRKAVIHNSDYQSKEEMEAAISRHFEERNAFFQANPKRAGNKIWDKEIFNVEELPGGLFRRM